MTLVGRFFGLTFLAYFLNVRRDFFFWILWGLRIVFSFCFVVLVSVRTVTSSEVLFCGRPQGRPRSGLAWLIPEALELQEPLFRQGWELARTPRLPPVRAALLA